MTVLLILRSLLWSLCKRFAFASRVKISWRWVPCIHYVNCIRIAHYVLLWRPNHFRVGNNECDFRFGTFNNGQDIYVSHIDDVMTWKSSPYYRSFARTTTGTLRFPSQRASNLYKMLKKGLEPWFESPRPSSDVSVMVKLGYTLWANILGPLLLTWFNFNSSMDIIK